MPVEAKRRIENVLALDRLFEVHRGPCVWSVIPPRLPFLPVGPTNDGGFPVLLAFCVVVMWVRHSHYTCSLVIVCSNS